MAAAQTPGAPQYPRCEYLVDPLAIGTTRPRLSWEVNDPRQGAVQTAYQILVASTPELLANDRGDRWDSGRVASAETCQVEYDGAALQSRDRCYWKVRTFDGAGQASPWSEMATWRMGLAAGDWQARWIGDPAPAPEMRPAHNGYHSQFTDRADDAKWVAIDLGSPQTIDRVVLHPARPFDWKADRPGFMFPVRFRVEVSDEAKFAGAKVVIDPTADDLPNPGAAPQTYTFPAVKARYVRLVATKLGQRDPGEFGLALAEMEVFAGDTNVALRRKVTARDSTDSNSWSRERLTDGDTTSHPASGQEPLAPPLLRKAFRVPGKVVRATAYTSALGVYELRLNGQRVGDQILAPEWTDYHKKVQYQTYDVTALVREGDNVVGALLGDGWYAGRLGISWIVPGNVPRGHYGRRPELLCQLEIETADGQVTTIATDGSWQCTTNGPLRSADLLDGERYDARLEADGWDRAGFDAAGWVPAKVGDSAAALIPQPNEPIRVIATLPPRSVAEPQPGVYVFDLGQNMVGWVKLTVDEPAGTEVRLRFGEMLNDDGTLYTKNLRSAQQTDTYVCRGGGDTWAPRFTYHGFRYVEVTGLSAKPDTRLLEGQVFCSAAPEVGRLETSDPSLNRLWANILWTQRANFMSTPTDCPQRDERLGWTGDIQAFSRNAMLNADLAAFMTKWLADLRDAQTADGRFPDFAPHPYGPEQRFSGVPAWGDAGTVVPWATWEAYGDRRLLADSFDAARRWVDWIHRANPDLIWRNLRHNDYGDWLNADTLLAEGWPKSGGACPKDMVGTLFFAHSADLVSRMAQVLGKADDAKAYAELFQQIRAAFAKEYVQDGGRLKGDTQAGYALALNFGLLDESLQPLAVEHILRGIAAYGGHLSTGFVSTHRLMLELSRRGRNEVAYELLNVRTFPSWYYSLDQGATTIWERWDGYVKGRGFQNPGMNSFAHYSLGSVGEWIYKVVLGLRADESAPGYRHFVIQPQPGAPLTWVRGGYRSIRGDIKIAWRHEAGQFQMDVTIPPNTTATVHVPTTDAAAVRANGQPAGEVAGLASTGKPAVYEAVAGTWSFTAPRP